MARTRSGPHASADPHAAVAAGLDPLATHPTGLPDQRGVDARRFDALVGLATDTGADARADGRAHSGQCHGPALNISLNTLLGLDDELAWLAGHGAVPADVARELLAAGHHYRRILTDPFTGKVLGVDGHLHHLNTATRTTTSRAADDTTTRIADVLPTPDSGATVAPTTTAPLPITPARVEGADAVPHPPGDRRTGTPPVPPPATTGQVPPGLADKLTRIADAAAPGTTTPRWASAGANTSDHGTTPASTCPLAGLPTDYVPTAEQSRYVRAALPECTHPGCTVPAVRCDLDHQVPHGAGGPTCECNLRPRCRKHHQCRTHYGWLVQPITDDPDDPHGLGTRWTSPLGLVHDDPAPPFLPPPIAGNDEDGTPLPAGWDLGDPLDCSYPTVDMAWPGATLLVSAAATATTHHSAPRPPAPPVGEEDDPPPF